MNKTQTEAKQVIKPIFPYDHEIVKITNDTGDVTYRNFHPGALHDGDVIRVMDEELDLSLACLLEPLDVIEKSLCNSDNIPIANTIAMVRQSISNTFFEMCQLIEEKIGVIKITRIYENEINAFHRWGRCIDAKLLPPDASEDH